MMPADEYVASLARKTMGAGALFLDEAGRVLLVDPVYRVTPLIGGRIAACLEALRSGTVASLENGGPVG